MTPGLHRFLTSHESWVALATRSHCERLVGEQLRARGYSIFTPEVPAWSWRGPVRRAWARPLFPGHLFVKDAGERGAGLRLLGARGVLGVVPDREIDAIRRVLDAFLFPMPHSYVTDGRRVTIRRGPLSGVEGFLLDTAGRALFVLSVHLFRRSVAVEIDRALAAQA